MTIIMWFLLMGVSFAAAPPAPKDLKATHVEAGGFTLSWSPAPGAYAYDVLGLPKLVRVYSVTSAKVTGLRPNTEYKVTMKSINRANEWSPSSVPLLVKTTATAPLPTPVPTPAPCTGKQPPPGCTLKKTINEPEIYLEMYECK